MTSKEERRAVWERKHGRHHRKFATSKDSIAKVHKPKTSYKRKNKNNKEVPLDYDDNE